MTRQKEDFEHDGFLIVERFLSEGEMDDIELHLNHYIKTIVPTLPAERVFFENEDSRSIKSMNRMDEYDPYWSDFKHNKKILALVSEVLNAPINEIAIENLQYFGKPAFEGSVTPWHQDNGFQQYDPPESLMIWLALRDVDENMGCVVFSRGSHKLGTLQHINSGVLGFSQTVAEVPDLSVYPEVNSLMKRGGVSLHHCNLLHRSGPNLSDRPRPALSVNYRTKRATADLEKRARIKKEVDRLVQKAVNK